MAAVLRNPPKPRLAFRVGVTGHRPNRLPQSRDDLDSLQRRLNTVVAEVSAAVRRFAGSEQGRSFYDGRPPTLRAVSPLAEGADRMFASSAIEAGYGLWCPLPFARQEYEKDFPARRGVRFATLRGQTGPVGFQDLLTRAKAGGGLSVFELDGDRTNEAAAYGDAGRLVVNQSDLLVMVWDGGPPQGGGGTLETLDDALAARLPVIWIDTKAPFGCRLLHHKSDLGGPSGPRGCEPLTDAALAAAIEKIVLNELSLPSRAERLGESSPEGGPHPAHRKPEPTPAQLAQDYFSERKPLLNLAVAWRLFRNGVADGDWKLPPLRVRDFVEECAPSWPTLEDIEQGRPLQAPAPSPATSYINGEVRSHFAWADRRADLYADAHRSAFIVTSTLAAMAVFLAVLPAALRIEDVKGPAETLANLANLSFVAAEGLMLLWLLGVLALERQRRWHQRWLEYRLLAEWLRHLSFLVPLGGIRTSPRVPAHLAVYGEPTQTWMHWYLRAISRAVASPGVAATPDYVRERLDQLAAIVGDANMGQIQHHQTSELRSERIHERLHQTNFWLVILTIGAVVVHLSLLVARSLAEPFWPEGFGLLVSLTLLAATALPALSASIANVDNQGEFARMAKRCRSMAGSHGRFKSQIEALRMRLGGHGPSLKLAEVGDLARSLADAMAQEVVDWRVIVIDLPHAPG